MKLRPVVREDIAHIVELGRSVHQESRFADISYDAKRFTANLIGMLDRQQQDGTHCLLLVKSREDQTIGILLGVIERYFFTDMCSASTILIWVDPNYRGSAAAVRLIGSFREWGQKRGVHEVCIGVASGVTIGRTDRFLRHMGFVQTGGNYAMRM